MYLSLAVSCLTLIIVALIGLIGHKKLEVIHIDTNSRLSKALEEIATLRADLEKEHNKDG